MTDFDVVVVGNGLFGSAAARHLSQLDNSVAVIGPDEPADHKTHNGVFASHYDQGRLTRLQDRNVAWAPITRRAVENYRALELASGVDFHYPVGVLIVARPDRPVSRHVDPLAMVRDGAIDHTLYDPDDKRWRAEVPYFEFPTGHYVIHEPAPAGYINPRQLIRAQNVVATQHGATVVRQIVTAVAPNSTEVVVTTADGSLYRAAKVVVAAGAFTNFNNLLGDTRPLSLKTEVVVLGAVSPETAEALRHMPTVKYMTDQPDLEGIYMVPPVRFPDGNHYLKIGANTPFDTSPATLAEVQEWFRTGDSDSCLEAYETALRAMMPDTEFLSFETKRCIVSYTPTDLPIIEQVDDRVFVAAGGNGGGAKGSDAWGELAAGLVQDGRWPGDLARFPG